MSKHVSKYLSLIGREFIWHKHLFGPEITYQVDILARIVEVKNNYVVCDTFQEGDPPARERIYMAQFLHEVDDEEIKAIILQPTPKLAPKNERIPYAVYTLADPRDASIRYVGISKHVTRRYQEHITCSGTNLQKNIWVIHLLQENLQPQLTIIETVIGSQAAKEREAYWIEHHLKNGSPLTNIIHATAYADGGTWIDNPDLAEHTYKEIMEGRQ